MKSNQLMSIPFNGRANFDQIDFVKCNRERHTQTSYHVHICSFNKWPQIFAGSANIQLPRTLHWARTQCEFGKSVYYFLVNRFDSICRHAVRDQSRTFVGKDWSAKIYTYTHFQPFSLPLCRWRSRKCKCSQKWQKRRRIPRREMFPLKSINGIKISGKEMYPFLLNNWYFRTTYKNNQDNSRQVKKIIGQNVQNITMQYKLTLVAKKYRENHDFSHA